MEIQSKISSLIETLGLTDEDLILHKKAHDLFARTGSEKALNNIPQEKRDRFSQFYRKLREWGLYDYRPDTRRCRRMICGYYELWVQMLKNDPNRTEMRDVTEDQVRRLIENGLDDLRQRTGIGGEEKGNIDKPIHAVFREIRQ